MLADAAALLTAGRRVTGFEDLVLFVFVAVHEAVYAHVCLVDEQVRLEMGLERGRQRQLLNTIDGRVGGDGPAAELLQGQHCNRATGR